MEFRSIVLTILLCQTVTVSTYTVDSIDVHTGEAGTCTDRLGELPVDRFHHRSCSNCYTFLFHPSRKALVPAMSTEALMFKDQSHAYFGVPIFPDPANSTAIDLVCQTLTRDECLRWRACCGAAVDCCQRQRSLPPANDDGAVCSRTWDGYRCWDDAPAGTIQTTACPSYIDNVQKTEKAIKECTSNGTWARRQGVQWTDYSGCLGTDVRSPGSKCTDRQGHLPVDRFHHRSCTMCYVFLFQDTKALGPARFAESLTFFNQSQAFFRVPISPDPANTTIMNLVCETLTRDECLRWRSCCDAAVDCCQRQRYLSPAPDDRAVCSRTWDGYRCWDDAPAGTIQTTACPAYIDNVLQSRSAFKECTANGTWVRRRGVEWTDYTNCVDIESFLVVVYICVGCNAASILLVLPAIVIFLAFRDLKRQHRVRLHINFFLALLLRSVTVILWFMLVHHEKLTNEDPSEAVLIQNPVWCRVLSFFKIYLNSATYFWMFCEGYYLHRLISRAFEPPKTLLTLYIIGWGVPGIPAVIYSILRVVYDNNSCWVFNLGNKEWVLYGPNLLCIVLNIVFLCNILRILLFQIHSHPHEPSSFRRGLKAAFMLIPLFGIQLVLTIYRPSANMEGNLKAYEYTTTIVINSQGVFVSLIFCFFNGEVLAHFHDRCCGCGQQCLKPFVRTRVRSAPMTQVTYTEDRRSPTNSLRSHGSVSPKRNGGQYAVNAYKDIALREISHSRDSSHSSLNRQQHVNGSSQIIKGGYTAVSTCKDDPTAV